nr:cation diffusion facilitator family transporter [Candidatus Freyarchaeota archaeon]
MPVDTHREMRVVALSSVLAAVFLVTFKFVVGVFSNSLGILSEALHSGLDLAAAAITFFAVRAAVKPADIDHQFGHGKIENLSALAETILLLVTCAWIVYEAINRIFFTKAEVEVSIWTFLVMSISIVIDFSRSRALYRVARKHNSQALEADALHFRTDIWSSSVVILGLALVWISENTGLYPLIKQLEYVTPEFFLLYEHFHVDILLYADSFAALVVACIVIYVSYRLGKRTVDALLDRAPKGVSERVKKVVSETNGVQECSLVRVRPSGPKYFVVLNVSINQADSLKKAHDIALDVEKRVKGILPTAEVIIHTDPTEIDEVTTPEKIRDIALVNEFKVHGVHIHEAQKKTTIDLHLEVPPQLSLRQTHKMADRLEEEIREKIPKVEEVNIHLEPAEEPPTEYSDVTHEAKEMKKEIKEIVENMIGPGKCHEIRIKKTKDKFHIYIHCTLDETMPIRRAHELTSKIELKIKKKIPEIEEINIHTEPPT